jgi:hypothetical protein
MPALSRTAQGTTRAAHPKRPQRIQPFVDPNPGDYEVSAATSCSRLGCAIAGIVSFCLSACRVDATIAGQCRRGRAFQAFRKVSRRPGTPQDRTSPPCEVHRTTRDLDRQLAVSVPGHRICGAVGLRASLNLPKPDPHQTALCRLRCGCRIRSLVVSTGSRTLQSNPAHGWHRKARVEVLGPA